MPKNSQEFLGIPGNCQFREDIWPLLFLLRESSGGLHVHTPNSPGTQEKQQNTGFHRNSLEKLAKNRKYYEIICFLLKFLLTIVLIFQWIFIMNTWYNARETLDLHSDKFSSRSACLENNDFSFLKIYKLMFSRFLVVFEGPGGF